MNRTKGLKGRPKGSTRKDMVEFDRDCMNAALQYRNISIRKMGREESIHRNDKTLRGYMKSGRMPESVLEEIANYVDADTRYLKGIYHKEIIESDYPPKMKSALLAGLKPDKYPYVKKEQRELEYKKYIDNILIIHGISTKQFTDLDKRKQWELQIEIEKKIVPVLLDYFEMFEDGDPVVPAIWSLLYEIESYGPDDLDIPEECPDAFYDDRYYDDDYLDNKWSN